MFNPKDVWAKFYSDTTRIRVVTKTDLSFRVTHSEEDLNGNSQWIFPNQHLDAQAGEYLLTISQTNRLYSVSVFYITQ